MSINLIINGISYSYPEDADEDWGFEATDWAAAVSNATLQKTGGLFTLTNDVDFGATNGVLSKYFSSRDANPADAGVLRLTSANTIQWRNTANTANNTLGHTNNVLEWNGIDLVDVSSAQSLTNKTISGATPTEISYLVGVTSSIQTQFNAITGGSVLELTDLTDVNTSTPTNRNVLVADGVDFESRALVKADVSDFVDGDYVHVDGSSTMTGTLLIGDGSSGRSLIIKESGGDQSIRLRNAADINTTSFVEDNTAGEFLIIKQHAVTGADLTTLTLYEDGNIGIVGGSNIPTDASHLVRLSYFESETAAFVETPMVEDLDVATFKLFTQAVASGDANDILLQAGSTSDSVGNRYGGNVNLFGGNASNGSSGGAVRTLGGTAISSGTGGYTKVEGGLGFSGADGGSMLIYGGKATNGSGNAGLVRIRGGYNTGTGTGADVTISGGNAAASYQAGGIKIQAGGGNGLGGDVEVHAPAGQTGEAAIDLWKDTDTGHTTGNKVTLGVNASLAADVTFNLPADNGTVDYILETDGSGNTSWVVNTGGIIPAIGDLTDVVLTGSPTLSTDDVLVYNGVNWVNAPKTSVGVLDHTNLTSIGTNTHAQIDTHIADATLHFTEASIDHTAIANIGTNTHAQIDTHIADATLHFTEASISHTAIADIGTNTHAQIDTALTTSANHIADATLHFTEASISHTAIADIGTNSHVQIDSHIADATLHFTEASISHTAIADIGTNTHAQIDTHIADATLHFIKSDINLTDLGDVTNVGEAIGDTLSWDGTKWANSPNFHDSSAVYNGTASDSPTVTVTSNGTVITASVNGGASPLAGFDVYIDQTLLEYAADTIALTAGTDTTPQRNFVYIYDNAGTATLAVSSGGFPTTTDFVAVADVLCQSAASLQTDGSMKMHAWTDHLADSSGHGHLSHLNSWIRKQHATWVSGVAPTLTINVLTPDEVFFSSASGVVLQLHSHSYPAMDMAVSDEMYLVNHFTTPYTRITDMQSISADANGDTASGRTLNYIIWGVVSESEADCKLMCNLPEGSYASNKDQNAIDDTDGTAVYSIPAEYIGVGFLIARVTLKNTGLSTYTNLQVEDLRGLTPNTAAGAAGGGGGITDHSLLSNLLADDHTQYLLVDGTRAMGAALDMGTFAITNVGNVDGVDISAHVGSSSNPHSTTVANLTDTTITGAVKGDIIAYNGSAWVDLTAGTNDEVLTADSAEATGLKWAAGVSGSLLGDLSDVSLTGSPPLAVNDILTYRGGSPALWEHASLSVVDLNDVNNVNAPTPIEGDILTWDDTAAEWVSGGPGSLGLMSLNDQTGTTYTLVGSDASKNVTMTNAAASTLTIPANAGSPPTFPIGTEILITQLGAGQLTVGITTDTLNVNADFTKKLAGQYSEVVITKKTLTMWVISGDLELVP